MTNPTTPRTRTMTDEALLKLGRMTAADLERHRQAVDQQQRAERDAEFNSKRGREDGAAWARAASLAALERVAREQLEAAKTGAAPDWHATLQDLGAGDGQRRGCPTYRGSFVGAVVDFVREITAPPGGLKNSLKN